MIGSGALRCCVCAPCRRICRNSFRHLPEKCAFSAVRWPDGMLAENGIAKVEELELVFRAYDADDWLKEDLANQRITLHP